MEELTAHIEAEPTAEHLYQRAVAYRALGQLKNAIRDLQAAGSLAPGNLAVALELSRTQLAASEINNALNSANLALKLAKSSAQKSSCHILRAEAYFRSKRFKPSLQACQLAFREIPNGEIEWFILRSENQRQLGQHQQRINDLKAGLDLHHSAVIKSHWVDAIIDAGDFETALPLVEAELADRRWRSSWLIKRGRTHLGLEQTSLANADFHAALKEINTRLNPKRPDPLLLADQGTAYALLGNNNEARKCLKALQHHRAAPWITSRLESLVK